MPGLCTRFRLFEKNNMDSFTEHSLYYVAIHQQPNIHKVRAQIFQAKFAQNKTKKYFHQVKCLKIRCCQSLIFFPRCLRPTQGCLILSRKGCCGCRFSLSSKSHTRFHLINFQQTQMWLLHLQLHLHPDKIGHL